MGFECICTLACLAAQVEASCVPAYEVHPALCYTPFPWPAVHLNRGGSRRCHLLLKSFYPLHLVAKRPSTSRSAKTERTYMFLRQPFRENDKKFALTIAGEGVTQKYGKEYGTEHGHIV